MAVEGQGVQAAHPARQGHRLEPGAQLLAQGDEKAPGPKGLPLGPPLPAQHQHGAKLLSAAQCEGQHGRLRHPGQGPQSPLHLIEGDPFLLELHQPIPPPQQRKALPSQADAIAAEQRLVVGQEGGVQQQAILIRHRHPDPRHGLPGGVGRLALTPGDAAGLAAAKHLQRQDAKQLRRPPGMVQGQGPPRGDQQAAAGRLEPGIQPAEQGRGGNQRPLAPLGRQLLRIAGQGAAEGQPQDEGQQDAKQQAIDVLMADARQQARPRQRLAPARHQDPELGLELTPGLGDRLGLPGGARGKQGQRQDTGGRPGLDALWHLVQRQSQPGVVAPLPQGLAVGQHGIERGAELGQGGRALVAGQHGLAPRQGAGEQGLCKQQAVLETQGPAPGRQGDHPLGQGLGPQAQLAQPMAPLRAEGHLLIGVPPPDEGEQAALVTHG